MRRERIMSLYRCHGPRRSPGRFFFRQPSDPPGYLRDLMDSPETLRPVAEVERKRGKLQPREMDPANYWKGMTGEEIAEWVGQIGLTIEDTSNVEEYRAISPKE